MGVALYRKYRSRKLSDVVGQEHVTTLLTNAISSGRVAHAYLFTGPRGVGKTSIARILAHEINGLPYDDESTHLDIIEIDAASNNGVEDIRDLRDRVQIAPVSAKKKVYIIDEVHMLSKPAFNALLKTLEEPPEHVVFILATTDIDKVPETIISRTQRHSFRRASEANIVKNLHRIAKYEKANTDDEALQLIAKHSDGSFRDSVSLFDQLLSGSDGSTITAQNVIDSLGLVAGETVLELINGANNGDIAAINSLLSGLEAVGVPPRTTARQLTDYLRGNLATDPSYALLINELLDVSRSNYPELKLLTALSLHIAPTRSTTQAITPTPVVAQTAQQVSKAPIAESKLKKAPTPTHRVEKSNDTPAEIKKKTAKASTLFNWEDLVSYVRTHHVALHSVLSKCDPEIDGQILRLYTKSAFYKKKLDDSKYRLLLNNSLTELGFEFDIQVLATVKPLKDSQAAKVAAIMGGGEEVSVDDA